jgi:hypothetical protein
MLGRGARTDALRKEAKTICPRKQKEYEENTFKSFDIDTREMKCGNFMKGRVTLRGAFNQELQYVGIRLGT